jgi:hypothetical protein
VLTCKAGGLDMEKQICCVCKQEKDKGLFYVDKTRKTGIRPLCKECHSQKSKDRYFNKGGKEKQKVRAQRYNLKKYGLSVEQYSKMVEDQQGLCKICRKNESHRTSTRFNLFVDHDHTTGKVRGLLCHHCNVGLGHFEDNRELLERAIRYLDENSS